MFPCGLLIFSRRTTFALFSLASNAAHIPARPAPTTTAGKDTLFGRAIENKLDKSKAAYDYLYNKILSLPFEQGPFYAVKLYPCLLNTQGGPRRNAKCEVLNPLMEPIPHLWSAGELGSFWGPIYQGAGNNAESIITGRIAGKNAAEAKDVSA